MSMLTHWNRLTASTLANASRLSDTHIASYKAGNQHFSHIADIGADCSGIIATGVDASSRIGIGRDNGVALSLNHGHLDDEYNLVRYDDTLRVLCRHFPPSVVVSDSHPGLASSRIARALAHRSGALLIGVDHSHSHITAVMAEHGLQGRAVGIVLDSDDVSETTDGRRLRGSELLVCSRRECKVRAQGEYLAIPRDADPWEAAVGLMLHVTGSINMLPAGLTAGVGIDNVVETAERCADPTKSVMVSGGEALWDAVAALIASGNGAADGPFRTGRELELLASGLIAAPYPIDPERPFSLSVLLDELLADMASHTDPRVIAARFHATQARSWAVAAARVAAEERIRQIVAGGDLLSNCLLRRQLMRQMALLGLTLYLPERISPGDAGVALGQATVAAALRA